MVSTDGRHAGRDDDRGLLHRVVADLERRIDRVRHAVSARTTPTHLRVVAHLGHGTSAEVVVRGRVVDDPEPSPAQVGESTWAAVRRTLRRFETDEVPGVPLRVTCGTASAEVVTDEEGYVDVRLVAPGPLTTTDGWATATFALAAPFRGLEPGPDTTWHGRVRITDDDADLGVISDLDDTVLHTGAQRFLDMARVTLTNSALTRTPFAGVAELYRAVCTPEGGPRRPLFYVSSSPWNLHGLLTAFLRHRGIPLGPLLLRDLGVDEATFVRSSHGAHKLARIREVLELHPSLRVVLVGDSGQHDPAIYARVVEEFPERVVAVWIREVRLDPDDGGVEAVAPRFERAGVPFLLAADSDRAADQAVALGLIRPADAVAVHRAVVRERVGADGPRT